MDLFRTLDPHPPTATPILGQSPKKRICSKNNWMVIFTKKFGTLDPPPIHSLEQSPKKTVFFWAPSLISQTLRRHPIHDHLPMQSNIQKRRQRIRYLTRLTTSRRKNSLRWKKWSQAVKNQQKVAQTRFGTIPNWFPTNKRTTATSSISASIVFTFFITCCEYLIKLTISPMM